MGVCYSKKNDKNNDSAAENQNSENQLREVSEEDLNDKEDVNETTRHVTLLILGCLCKSLSYERKGFSELANKRGLANYMEVIGPSHFEKVFRKHLELNEVPEGKKTDETFPALVKAATEAKWREGHKTNLKFALDIKDAAMKTQKEMETTMEMAVASDLKAPLLFFRTCLDVVKTASTKIFSDIDKLVSDGTLAE